MCITEGSVNPKLRKQNLYKLKHKEKQARKKKNQRTSKIITT